MGLEVEHAEADTTQRTYARLAGILFLGVILIALIGGSILSRVAGSGTFAETAARITASERLYRVGLSTVLMASLGSTLLAFALYATLRPVNRLLAQLALIFSLNDSFLALIVRMCGFARMHLYVSAQTSGAGLVTAQTLVDLLRTIGGTTENLGGICFGIGSALFYYLFFKSRYIPRFVSALGLCASVIWTGLYLANLIFPERHALFQYLCFPPMALADIATGLYLMLFAVKSESPAISLHP
ncbi:MAG: DUF4386 domain-containing protein [Candidatus Sulfotelmatobacter sp.]